LGVWDRLRGRIDYGERLHFTLIDPEKADPATAKDWAERAVEAGTDAIMVGGSAGFTEREMSSVVSSIRGLGVPIIIFPSGSRSLVPGADLLFFLSLMNSRDPRFIVGIQASLSRRVLELGLETVGIGYLIVEPGMKVGEVGRADPIPRDRVDLAVAYALAAQFMGMGAVYLEAGSGAPEPVPARMIRAVSEVLRVPLIVGGGVRDPASAMEAARAGADILVTGTLVEETGARKEILSSVIEAFKGD